MVFGVTVGLHVAGFAHLQQEVARAAELQYVRVSAPISADPDVVHGVDDDAVIRLWPIVPSSWTTPGPDQIALGIELENGRCREAALLRNWRIECRGHLVIRQVPTVNDPNVIARVHRYADRRPEQPMIRKRLGP